jgi:hypothetical protein
MLVGTLAGRRTLMAKTGRLTALAVEKAKKPGLMADGGGLYFQVGSSEARSWFIAV